MSDELMDLSLADLMEMQTVHLMGFSKDKMLGVLMAELMDT